MASNLSKEASERIRWMPLSVKRWFWSDFDADADLHEIDVQDFIATTPAWVVGDSDLTPLGREVRRQLAEQVSA
jgi:hypothetical protein